MIKVLLRRTVGILTVVATIFALSSCNIDDFLENKIKEEKEKMRKELREEKEKLKKELKDSLKDEIKKEMENQKKTICLVVSLFRNFMTMFRWGG